MAKATLINKSGQKAVVESGSQQAKDYFGKGYQLMGASGKYVEPTPAPAPATPQLGSIDASGSFVPTPSPAPTLTGGSTLQGSSPNLQPAVNPQPQPKANLQPAVNPQSQPKTNLQPAIQMPQLTKATDIMMITPQGGYAQVAPSAVEGFKQQGWKEVASQTKPITTAQNQPPQTSSNTELIKKVEATNPNLIANDNFVNGVIKAYLGRDATAQELAQYRGQKTGAVISAVRGDNKAVAPAEGTVAPTAPATPETPATTPETPAEIPAPETGQGYSYTEEKPATAEDRQSISDFYKQQTQATRDYYDKMLAGLDAQNKAFIQQYMSQPSMADELKLYRDQFGLPKLESLIGNIDEQIINTETLLDNLEGDIQARTKGMPVSESARRRMYALESAPLTKDLKSMLSQREKLSGELTQKEKYVKDLLEMSEKDREKELEMGKMQLEMGKERLSFMGDLAQEEMQFAREAALIDIKSKLEKGSADTTVETFTNNDGTVTIIGLDKRTGEQLYKKTYDGIGGAKVGSDDLLSPADCTKLGVPYGTTKTEAAKKGILPSEQLTVDDRFRMETTLKNDFEKYIKDYRTTSLQMSNIEIADGILQGEDPNALANPAGQAMVMAYNKIIDPLSVVRETEYGRSAEGQSLWNQISGVASKIISGGTGITNAELHKFFIVASKLHEGQGNLMMNYAKNTYNTAVNYGLNVNNVLTPDIAQKLKEEGYVVPQGQTGTANPSSGKAFSSNALDSFFEWEGTQKKNSNSSMNRPQHNNNPGNIKSGGIADQYAKKDANGKPMTDDQGHLIFASADDGFKGMKADLKAKIEGRNRHGLNGNSTLREIGKVYAEDSNWPISVAKLLGISPDAKIGSINFDKLVQAVATQEGFYA